MPESCSTWDREVLVQQFGEQGADAFLAKSQATKVPRRELSEEAVGHVSTHLALLNTAAKEIWAKADPKDERTHPSNAYATAWFIERGISRNLAQLSVQIIRPAWAVNSRRRHVKTRK